MITPETYAGVLTERTEFLAMMVLLGALASPLAERGPFARLVHAGREVVGKLGKKLNREHRNVATRVYRGMIAVIMLLIPPSVVGVLLMTNTLWATLFSTLSILLWFGYCFATTTSYALWRHAKNERVPLQLPHIHYLFADSHAVIRFAIATRMEIFAVGIVGGCWWYMVGGWTAMAIYLTLAAANDAYGKHLAFGWAANTLFRAADAIPRGIARILIALAALITPHCRPVASILAPNWRMAICKTLGISLGGAGPNGIEPWVGSGKARLTHQHVQRMAYLLAVATLLLLASAKSHKLLSYIYN